MFMAGQFVYFHRYLVFHRQVDGLYEDNVIKAPPRGSMDQIRGLLAHAPTVCLIARIFLLRIYHAL